MVNCHHYCAITYKHNTHIDMSYIHTQNTQLTHPSLRMATLSEGSDRVTMDVFSRENYSLILEISKLVILIYYLYLLFLSKPLILSNSEDWVKTISLWVYFNYMQTNFSFCIALFLKQPFIYNINFRNVTKVKFNSRD